MTDDVGFGAPEHLRRRDPHARAGPHRQDGPALHAVPFHGPLLADPRRADHRAGTIIRPASAWSPSRPPATPATTAIITRDKATVGRILKDNGYRTSWFGKDHNTPAFQASQVGPFDQWPIGMGFEYFYGFVGGDTSQWQPNLFRNTTQIYPYQGKPGWNLTTAMADEAIGYMNRINTLDPDKPFFVYYVPGGTHAPHHATPEWIEKISELHLSTRAGTSCASRSSPTRRSWA